MFFFFKRPKIVVDCFTFSKSAYELHKIRKANCFFPETIKNLPSVVSTKYGNTNIEVPTPTIKRCTGIKDLYSNGAIIPFWTEFFAEPSEYVAGNSNAGLISSPYSFTTHPTVQYPGIMEDFYHIKFMGVWNIKEKTGIDFLWISPTWNILNHTNDFLIPPASVNFNMVNQTNLNIFINKKCKKLHIASGTPIVHILPLTDKSVEYKCHLVSEQEFNDVVRVPSDYSFLTLGRNKRYFRDLERSKELDKKEKGKCPFGFGK